jgi:hypothetical protein
MDARDSVKVESEALKSKVKSKSRSESEHLSKDDLQYLFGLLDKAEYEIEEEAEEGYEGQNKRNTSSTRKRIMRIRLALLNYYS